MLEEIESKQRYNEYLREVRQEQLYQQVQTNQSTGKEFMMITTRSLKWLSFIVVLAALALSGYYTVIKAQPAGAESNQTVLEFEVAEDMTRLVFDEDRVDEYGMPTHGNPFITVGYLYPKGTLNGSNGVLKDGSPEFPDKVIGTWICRGWFFGEGGSATKGPWVITTQTYNFGQSYGETMLISEGFELATMGAPVKRAVTGGAGPYRQARGEASQTFLGFNTTAGVNLSFTLELDQPSLEASGL